MFLTGETLVNLEQLDDGRVRYSEGDNTGEPSHEGGIVRAFGEAYSLLGLLGTSTKVAP